MPSLKSLKIRITSVKNTRKITKAMQMVAASKLRRAQEQAEDSRPYATKMQQMVAALANNMDPNSAPALLVGRRNADGSAQDRVRLLVVVTADRGLCGGFNSSIVKKAKEQLARLDAEGVKTKIICAGRKGYDLLRRTHADRMLERIDTTQYKNPNFSLAETIAEKIISLFEAGEIDSCDLIFNTFVNVLTQKPTVQGLIPLDLSQLPANDNLSVSQYEYEPNEDAVLSAILPRNIEVQIFSGLLENAASVQGARMTAMDNATRNAGDMIKNLTLKYNRGRQAAITKELIEIISGAEAV